MVSWWCLGGASVALWWCLRGVLVVSRWRFTAPRSIEGVLPGWSHHAPSSFTVAPSSFQRFHPVVTLTIMTADDDDGDDDDGDDDDGGDDGDDDDDDDGDDDDGGDDDVDEDGDGDGDDDDDCMCLQVWVKAVSGRMLTYVWT